MNYVMQSEAAQNAKQWFGSVVKTADTLCPQKWEAFMLHGELQLFVKHPGLKRQLQADRLSGLREGFSILYSTRPKLIDVA